MCMTNQPRPQTDSSDGDAQRIAEETSKEIQPDDPMHEPPNSTVDDWFGQRVQADADRLDRSAARDVAADADVSDT